MSDIKVGDLVVVVKPRPSCGCATSVGKIFSVIGFQVSTTRCQSCGVRDDQHKNLVMVGELGFEQYRLKRIPPLSELEGQRTQEDMKEPA